MITIISGGQTGADRTALEVARELGLATGGTAPLGWQTDEGPDPTLADFGLKESVFAGYRVRTRANVRDAEGTVWFGHVDTPGFKCTASACTHYTKPLLINPGVEDLVGWLTRCQPPRVNVAGNRRRTNPAIVGLVCSVLRPALTAYLHARTVETLAAEDDEPDDDEDDDYRTMTRTTDPGTSHAAAASWSPEHMTEVQRRVLAIHDAHPEGLTDEELLQLYEREHVTAESSPRKRRCDLTRHGLIRDSGQRKPLVSGCKGIVWIRVREGEDGETPPS